MERGNFKVAFTYVGAVVGAGFASGQELVKFFVVFDNYGLLGTITAGIIFAILGAMVIVLVNRVNIMDYGHLLHILFPSNVCKAMDAIISLILWVGLGVMLTASGTLLHEQLNIPQEVGFTATALLVLLCLQLGSIGLLNTNYFLVPFLIFLAVSLSLIYIHKPTVCFAQGFLLRSLLPNWWTASFLYVGYNMVLAIVVLASIKDGVNNVSPLGALIGGAILGLMSFIMVKGLLYLPDRLKIAEMPMLAMTTSINNIIGNIYGVGLWIALFTTALANAHSLTMRISNKTKKPYKGVLILILISAFTFLPWRFSTLVGIIYPMEGYLAIPLIVAVIVAVFKVKIIS